MGHPQVTQDCSKYRGKDEMFMFLVAELDFFPGLAVANFHLTDYVLGRHMLPLRLEEVTMG